jgi:hypothetical protein
MIYEIRERISKITNIINRIFAMPAAATATPPKPNIAAIIDKIKNITTHASIVNSLSFDLSNAFLI